MSKANGTGRGAALMALASWSLALLAGGRELAAGWHLDWPLALAGARGVPGAMAFNGGAFVLPGLLAAYVAWHLRGTLEADAGWAARIGARLALLAGLAFAVQGLLPLDPASLDSGASGFHAAAWMAWASACVPAAALLALAPGPRGWRIACALTAAGVLAAAFGWGTPLGQRVAFALWLGWMGWAGVRADAGTDGRGSGHR